MLRIMRERGTRPSFSTELGGQLEEAGRRWILRQQEWALLNRSKEFEVTFTTVITITGDSMALKECYYGECEQL